MHWNDSGTRLSILGRLDIGLLRCCYMLRKRVKEGWRDPSSFRQPVTECTIFETQGTVGIYSNLSPRLLACKKKPTKSTAYITLQYPVAQSGSRHKAGWLLVAEYGGATTH